MRRSRRRCASAPPGGSSKSALKTVAGFRSDGSVMPSAFQASDQPFPISSDANRVCGAVFWAINWSIEIVFFSASPIRAPVSQIFSQMWWWPRPCG